MDRRARLLSGLRLEGLGLEIGPSIAPIAAGDPGLNVRTLDHLDHADLIAKYAEVGQDTSRIQPVDYVWSGERYRDLVGDVRFDWIIASHVIEHVPDLVRFLQQCEEILAEDGVLSLVVPDRRGCFDYFRPPSGLGMVIDAYLERRVRSSPGQVTESTINLARLDGQDMWRLQAGARPRLLHGPEAVQGLIDAVQSAAYVDTHNWVFTPHTFRLLLRDLEVLGLTGLRELSFTSTKLGDHGEFFVQLSRTAPPSALSRQALCELVIEDSQRAAGAEEGDEGELESLKRTCERQRAELDRLLASKSWRATAPLRALRRLFS